MKALKIVSLMGLVVALSSAISNWGSELTKNPMVVFIGIFAFAMLYTIAECDD